ncbi:unnamed protein product [Discosporangium mesarthrocarpum]
MRINFITHKSLYHILIHSKAYLGPLVHVLDSSLYPFLKGKRNRLSLYDLSKGLVSLLQALKLVEKIIAKRGTVLFVGGSPKLVRVLKHLPQVRFCDSPFFGNRVRFPVHLIILHEMTSKSIYEARQKRIPIIGFGGFNIKGITYPVSLNLLEEKINILYIYLITASIIRGFLSLYPKLKSNPQYINRKTLYQKRRAIFLKRKRKK